MKKLNEEMVTEEILVNELSYKYCKSQKFIILLIRICKDNNVEDLELFIENHLKSVSKSVSTI